jgi:hypothetical protein
MNAIIVVLDLKMFERKQHIGWKQMVTKFVIIGRTRPAIDGLDYYEIFEHVKSPALLIIMRFAHRVQNKTLTRIFINGFYIEFMQRSDAFFADIARVNVKQNCFMVVKRPVVKTADFVSHCFLYSGFHNCLELLGLAFHEGSNGFSPFGVLGVQNLS